MKKLLIIGSSLGKEGTSRFLTYLANNLTSNSNIQIKMLFLKSGPVESLRLLDAKVDVEFLNIRKRIRHAMPLIIKRILSIKPNYCLVGYHQLLWIGFFKPLFSLYGIKLMVRDTIIPSLFHATTSNFGKYLNKKAYKCYDYIVSQSVDMREDLINNWKCDRSKIVLINNPIDVNAVRASVEECPTELINKDIFTFIAAGRLVDQKGYDIIIDRMADFKPNPPFKLLVLGNGELEQYLKQLSREKDIEDYIKFLGYRTNVSSYIYYSDGLLLSSRYEGFPNIVLEANALGKPVFANNCKGGINEIIVEGQNGITCDFYDKGKFTEGLDKFRNIQFSASTIIELTRKRYDIPIIINKYNDLFSR